MLGLAFNSQSNFEPVHYSLHLYEGHFDSGGSSKRNVHCHIEFSTMILSIKKHRRKQYIKGACRRFLKMGYLQYHQFYLVHFCSIYLDFRCYQQIESSCLPKQLQVDFEQNLELRYRARNLHCCGRR